MAVVVILFELVEVVGAGVVPVVHIAVDGYSLERLVEEVEVEQVKVHSEEQKYYLDSPEHLLGQQEQSAT